MHYFYSLKPRLSVLDLVSQLWREIRPGFTSNFSPKLRDKIRNGKPGFEATIFIHKHAGHCSEKKIHLAFDKEEKNALFL